MDILVEALVEKQHELYTLPRTMERFAAYTRLMLSPDRDEVAFPPLNIINPMGKEHVLAAYTMLLEIDAEAIARHTLAALTPQLAAWPGLYHMGLVIGDDLGGGWTNRYFNELNIILASLKGMRNDWLTVVLWVSEPLTTEAVQAQVRTVVYRVLYGLTHGAPQTLAQVMAQEGVAAAWNGAQPTFSTEELAYSADVIAPYRDTTDYATIMACFYGDAIADSLGYPTFGLSPYAAREVAIAEALAPDFPWLLGRS